MVVEEEARGVRGGRTCGRERTRQRSTCRRFGVVAVGKHQGGGGDWVSQREGDNGRRDGTPGRCGKISGATPGNWAIGQFKSQTTPRSPSSASRSRIPAGSQHVHGPRPRGTGRLQWAWLHSAFPHWTRPFHRACVPCSDFHRHPPLQHEKRKAQMSKQSRKNTNPHLQ